MKKTLALLLALCLIVGAFAGCGSTAASSQAEATSSAPAEAVSEQETTVAEAVQEEAPAEAASEAETSEVEAAPLETENYEISMPLTEDPITLSFFMRFNPQVQDYCQDMSDNLFYQELEELSNVHIEFQLLHPSVFSEQFNLQVASGEYADIYCEAATNYNGGFDKAVEDDVLLDLTDLIEEYAPNYNAIIHSSEQNLRDAMTDEGRVVFIAAAYDEGQPNNKGPQIRADWAEEFGMDPDEIDTYAEYEAYIEQAYNTYGATVQLPMDGVPGFGFLTAGFETTAGFGNSFEATLPWFQIDGTVYSGITTDGFIEYTELMADWYSKGWIYQDFMSEDFGQQGGADVGMVTSGQSSLWWSEVDYIPQYIEAGTSTDPDFAIAAIKDATKEEGGVTHFAQTSYAALSISSNCAISTTCQYPEIALQWLDYRYTEEGSNLANWGVEGVTYEVNDDGSFSYTDLIVNNPEGMTATLAQFRYMLQNTVCLTQVSAKFQGFTDQQMEAMDIWMTNKDNDYGLPDTLTMTTEESDAYNNTASDITTYGQEHFLKFIVGDESIDDLQSFVNQCVSMGLEDLVAIQQQALDRYNLRGTED
jgi:putative aldouronate transport system substrate-binding protein